MSATVKPHSSTLRRIEDAEWLLDQGEWPERAARRVGWSLTTMSRMMARHSHRPDLIRQVNNIDRSVHHTMAVAA